MRMLMLLSTPLVRPSLLSDSIELSEHPICALVLPAVILVVIRVHVVFRS